MDNVKFNAEYWGAKYDWSRAGEEWSARWGGSKAQWATTLYTRIGPWLPAPTVLEIATGYGRWSEFLIPLCDRFIGVDLSEPCVRACQARFSAIEKAQFFHNDGRSLGCVEDGTVDVVFSFDSLVHASLDVLSSYVPAILQKLNRSGVAFIHHSNLAEVLDRAPNDNGRADDVSCDMVRSLVESNGGKILIQEKIGWRNHEVCDDGITLFGRADAYGGCETVLLENPDFSRAAEYVKKYHSPYHLAKR